MPWRGVLQSYSSTTPPPHHRWWKSPRRWAQMVMVSALAVLAVFFWRRGYGMAAAEYHEYQWGRYHPGPHVIVMDSSPSAANKQLDPILYDPNMPDASFAPAPSGWEHFPLDEKWPGAPLLLARRTEPSGTPVWVGLSFNFEYLPSMNDCSAALLPDFGKIRIIGSTASVVSFFHPSQAVVVNLALLRVDSDSRGLFRFYAGQPDPADSSRFTIDYTYDGKPGTIDGEVTNTGDIVLKPRTGVIGYGNSWKP